MPTAVTAQADTTPSREYLQLALLGLQSLTGAWVVFFDHELRYVLAAGTGLEEAGFARAAIEGRRLSELLPPDRVAFWEPFYRGALAGQSCSFDIRGVRQDRWYEVQVAPWTTPDGESMGGLSFGRDITQRRRQDSEIALLAPLVNAADDAIIGADLDNTVTIWNPAAERLFGFTAAEAIGRDASTLVASDRPDEVASIRAAAREGEIVRADVVRRNKDGRRLDLAITVSPVRDPYGRSSGRVTVARDIGERRRSEQANAQLAAIVASVDEAIVSTLPDGTIVSWNAGAERIYGYTASEAIGGNVEMLVPDAHAAELRGLLGSVAAGAPVTRVETVRVCKDGRSIVTAASLSPRHDAAGNVIGISVISRDITAEKQIEREREQALEELNEAQRLARVGSWRRDPATGEVSWSQGLFALLGRDPALGPPSPEEAFAHVHPDDRERILAATVNRPGGAGAFEFDFRLVTETGAERVVHARGRPDPTRPGAYLGTCQDVTAERAAERDRARLLSDRVQAETANRAKSEFLARMSHELRTPLNAIIGFTQLLALEPLEPEQQEDLGHVVRAGRHLLTLIDEVLDIARIEAGRMSISSEPVSVADTVREAVALLRPQAAERQITLELETAGLAPADYAFADRNRLKQVLLNLLSNALKYNRRGGSVTLTCTAESSGRVRIAVADTGLGIGPEHLAKLFVPFERLGAEQTEVEGTGLGLGLSRGLVELMGGSLGVVSTPGVGSTFTVELRAAAPPVAPDSSPTAFAGPALPGPDGGGHRHRILYIEDNLANLELVERIIARAGGAQLISAMQGRLGLELARDHHPDLILLDLHLPDMTGTEVLARLRADHPEIPVIVLTADASPAQGEAVRRLGAVDCLTKPVDVSQLLALVARQLPPP